MSWADIAKSIPKKPSPLSIEVRYNVINDDKPANSKYGDGMPRHKEYTPEPADEFIMTNESMDAHNSKLNPSHSQENDTQHTTDPAAEQEEEEEEEETDPMAEVQRMLQRLRKMEEEARKQWKPTLVIESSYTGNGFVTMSIVECNSSIFVFQLKYCFTSNHVAEQCAVDELEFHIEQFKPQKIHRDRLLVRIPQQLHDYHFVFQLRGRAKTQAVSRLDDSTVVTSEPFVAWTQWTELTSIAIPCDAAEHQFQQDEIVKFQLPNEPFWSFGKVIEIEQDAYGKQVAQILYKKKGKDDETYKVSIENLKFETRYRSKLVDLTDWMQLSQQLFFDGKEQNIEQVFVSVHDTLCANITHYIYDCDDAQDPERWSVIELVFHGDIVQDIKCCARFIALNVTQFLQESSGRDSADELVIHNGLSIGCGLCPIQRHYRTLTKLRNLWQYKLSAFARYGRETQYNTNMNYDYADMLENGVGVSCDICSVDFHHMSYLYCCDSKLEQQHDICMACMNRNVLQCQRLLNTLNDLYYLHELDRYCVAQIVYCIVGLIR
eukprot:CAMPEP_0197024306 /NCGR_PEP_ID=MMETSP1384-20130603/4877_1 /TAXON_ID=29189 /ORGANISM="Ammonia sp." /LENGTH=547 /DNA_ID=CAMNT_0042452669 /DNA_START=83 /DNA_END=1726 /DNA_ORIENTATION=-